MANLSVPYMEDGPRLAQPGPLATLFIGLCQQISDAGPIEVIAFFMMIPVMQQLLGRSARSFLWNAFKYGAAMYLGMVFAGCVAVEVFGCGE